MKIKIYTNTLNQLAEVKGDLLYHEGTILLIKDFKFIEEEVKYGFRKKKTKTVFFLIECTLLSYNNDGEFIGVNTDETVKRLLMWYDLYELRKAWNNFNKVYKVMTEYAETLHSKKISDK